MRCIKPMTRIAVLLVCSLALAACVKETPPTGQKENRMTGQHATGRTIGDYTYTDAPVDARLGPHVFMFPANYYRDQMGPSFDGSFSLLVQWPDLQPLPPGERSRQDMATFNRQITIAPKYVDRVPIETLLERYAVPFADPETLDGQDPRFRLDLMQALPERDGLTPYTVSDDVLAAYQERYVAETGKPSAAKSASFYDWFVRRSADGRLLTLIRCNHMPEAGERSRPQCMHDIVIPELQLAVSMEYSREFLPGWQRIEDRARALIQQYKVK